MSATNRIVKLTVINDLICTNCFIAHHELLEAIEYCTDILQLPLSFEVIYMPFRLISKDVLRDDESSKILKEDFYHAMIGKENFNSFQDTIGKWSHEKGVAISFKGVMSQSIRAHRLSRKAYQVGGQKLQVPLLRAIFKAYLQEAKDVVDIDVLSDIAAEVGVMSREEAIAFLQSKELEKEVNEMCDTARSKGITGVPITIIDGKWAVKGGQSSDVFVQIFKKLAAAGVQQAPSLMPGQVELCV